MARNPRVRLVIREEPVFGVGADKKGVRRGNVLHTIELGSEVRDAVNMATAMAKGLAASGYDVTKIVNREVEETTNYGFQVPEPCHDWHR